MSVANQDGTGVMLDLPPSVSADEARLAMSVRLFEKGRLSLGQAANLAGFSKRAFIDILGREGIPVINYPAEELHKEVLP